MNTKNNITLFEETEIDEYWHYLIRHGESFNPVLCAITWIFKRLLEDGKDDLQAMIEIAKITKADSIETYLHDKETERQATDDT